MEASGLNMRPNYYDSSLSKGGAGTYAHSQRFSFSCCSLKKTSLLAASSSSLPSSLSSDFSVKRGWRRNLLNVGGFYDKGQLEYYHNSSGIRCGGEKKKVKAEKAKEKSEKRMRLKLLKGLSRDLSVFSQMGFGLKSDHGDLPALVDRVKGKIMSEAAELLLDHLQQLRAEDKKLKRQKKDKSRLRAAASMKNDMDGSDMSSSSSSESSDSECDELVYVNRLKYAEPVSTLSQPVVSSSVISTQRDDLTSLQPQPQPHASTEEAIPPLSTIGKLKNSLNAIGDQVLSSDDLLEQQCCTRTSENPEGSGCLSLNQEKSLGTEPRKIEVCMGGKCKKSGAAAVLDEFQRIVDSDVAVSGCKCMGKCKDGPNVRVASSGPSSASSLCVGVDLENVGAVFAKFFQGNQKASGVSAAAAT